MVSAAQILKLDEVRTVVAFLKDIGTQHAQLNLVIFRLACCCGMRCKEIQGLNVGDLHHNGQWPYLLIRKEITKGESGKRKPRAIQLWDEETYKDLSEWQTYRIGRTGDKDGPFVASLRADHKGNRMSRSGIAAHWTRTLARALGPDRARAVSIHKGRHTYTSLCHAAGIPLVDIRDALGHSSLAVTDIYCHSTAKEGIHRNVFGKGE